MQEMDRDIADRLALRELVEAYNDAVMRFDAKDWAATWADDATWTVPGIGEFRGRDAIVAAWQQAMQAFSFVGFFASAGPLQIEGDRAKGRWYQQEVLQPKDGPRSHVTGRYEDTYVREDDGWRFTSRTYSILDARQLDG